MARRKRKRKSKKSWSFAGVVSAVAGLYVFSQVGQDNGVAGLAAGGVTFLLLRAGIRRLIESNASDSSSRRMRAGSQGAQAGALKVAGEHLSEAEVVPWLLEHWDQVSDKVISKVENGMKGTGESDLLYALRVAGPGLRAKTLTTLVSRWRTTRCGAGDSGLDAGRSSPNHALTASFLMTGFSQRLREIAQEDLTKALETVGERKSQGARSKAAQRAVDKYEDAIGQLEASDDAIFTAAVEFRAKYKDCLGDYLGPT